MKKKVGLLLLAVVMIVAIAGFSEVITLTLWTAPNPNQNLFWKTLLVQWSKTHPNIKIKWSQIPAAGSSEEAILTAIASNRQPDICTNIFSGFAAELISSKAIVPLDSFAGFESLVKTRDMSNVIKKWEYNGHYYVFPIYVNPMLIWWRKDILAKYGFNEPPRTYSQIYALAKKVVIPHKRYAYQVVTGVNWWSRWFDFITDYYAASAGKPYIYPEKQVSVFNNKYGKEVANFIYTMFKNHYTAVDLGNLPFYNGAVVGMIMGPWSIPYAQNQFPNIFKNDVVVTPPPVPDNYPKNKPIYTFADTKGMIIFKTSKHKEAAWEFMKWVYSNPEHDVLWIKLTQMPPAREDLLTNKLFAPYLKDPVFAAYAKYVPYAVPTALSAKTVSIQQAMTNKLIEPLMYLKTTPQKALNDAVTAVNNVLFQ